MQVVSSRLEHCRSLGQLVTLGVAPQRLAPPTCAVLKPVQVMKILILETNRVAEWPANQILTLSPIRALSSSLAVQTLFWQKVKGQVMNIRKVGASHLLDK